MPAKFQVGEPDTIRTKKLNSFRLSFGIEGKPSNAQELVRFVAVRDMRIADMGGNSDVAATGSAQFSLTSNGVSVATATWGASGKTAAGAVVPNTVILKDSVVKLIAPATQDATLDKATVWVDFVEG